MILNAPEAKVKTFSCNIGRGADTYVGCTATGNVIIESISFYVSVAGGGMDNVSFVTSQTNATTILTTTEGATANLVAQKVLAYAFSRFPIYLANEQKINYIVAGTGTSGTILMTVKYRAAVQGQAVSLD